MVNGKWESGLILLLPLFSVLRHCYRGPGGSVVCPFKEDALPLAKPLSTLFKWREQILDFPLSNCCRRQAFLEEMVIGDAIWNGVKFH